MDLILYIIIGLLVIPIFVYLCVKFGVFAFYQARRLANKENNNSTNERNN